MISNILQFSFISYLLHINSLGVCENINQSIIMADNKPTFHHMNVSQTTPLSTLSLTATEFAIPTDLLASGGAWHRIQSRPSLPQSSRRSQSSLPFPVLSPQHGALWQSAGPHHRCSRWESLHSGKFSDSYIFDPNV